jgi:hypothetical protein
MNLARTNVTALDYEQFRSTLVGPPFKLKEPADFHDPIPVSEKLVQAIWHDQLFDFKNLETREGFSIEVLNPGRWNREGGPDFLGARLLIGGKTVVGDVEIHLHSTGWDEHRHSNNPVYNGVILDVCLWDLGTSALQRQDKEKIPQLILYPFLQCPLDELAESLDPDRYPFSPTRIPSRFSPLTKLSKQEISSYIESAGLFRFQQKTSRFVENITLHGEEQSLYMFLSEALGYKHNKLSFRQIAIAQPILKLRKISNLDSKIDRLLEESQKQRLRVSQVRPANHPYRRLACLAILTEQFPKLGDWARELAKNPKLLRQPPALKHPFWSWRYHPVGKRLPKPVALLGQSRWNEIVTNVILPFCAADAQLRQDSASTKQIIERWVQLPATQSNLASRQMEYDLGIQPPKKMLQQQGLIQVYQDFDWMFP